MTPRRRFWHVAGAGTAFQAGSAGVDSATVMSALVFQLTGSPLAVGAVTTILRMGWLLPQILIGFLAGRSGASMPYYIVGAVGRAAAIALLAGLLWLGSQAGWSHAALGAGTLILWTLYAGLSGIVGVPYNDIVARSVPSEMRSRLLALRFFGGGLVALAVAVFADNLLHTLTFPLSFAAILGVAAMLMGLSALVFLAMGEPERIVASKAPTRFSVYLREGIETFRTNSSFRRFVFAQWCGAGVMIAMPFYVVAAEGLGIGLENVALLLGAQTAGALVSNSLWGWWGDSRGKLSLMRLVAVLRMAPPVFLLVLLGVPTFAIPILPILILIFILLGALANGLTIAVLGLLMEISPEDRRPAYSGYFNALTAPSYVLPLLGGVLFSLAGAASVFIVSLLAAAGQAAILQRMKTGD
ncbi:MFS transporter [Aurantimonas sp. A2-1-M11]|uniref:MFS transporter n=1 Tax=Aurantimonas sp. A2-1-M11 TaxID=3113712 RepID=UPI002F93222B